MKTKTFFTRALPAGHFCAAEPREGKCSMTTNMNRKDDAAWKARILTQAAEHMGAKVNYHMESETSSIELTYPGGSTWFSGFEDLALFLLDRAAMDIE